MRWPRAINMVAVAAVLLVAVGPTGCGKEECSCGGPDLLHVRLASPVPSGGAVEVCFDDACETAGLGGTRQSDAFVDATTLGAWLDDPALPVTISVLDAEGALIHRESATAHRIDGGCCPDYWSIREDPTP